MKNNPWLLVAMLWVVALLNYVDRQVVFSLFPLLEKDLQASGFQLGLISTVFLWVYGPLSPFAGYLADRFGRGRVIMISLLVWSLITWLTGHCRTIEQLLVARALMGVSEACYLPAALALISDVHGQKTRSLATGLHQSGLYVGMIVGGAWGGWMGEHYGWRPVFTILGLTGVLYFAVAWLMLHGRKDRSAPGEQGSFAASMRQLFSIRGFGAVTTVFAAFSVANWLIYTWLPVYLYEKFHLSLTHAGFSATFYIQVASFAGILLGGVISDRWVARTPRGRLYTQALGLAAAAPFIFLLGFSNSFPLLIVALVTVGLGRGFYDCNGMPVLAQLAPRHLCATGYGIFNLAGNVVGGITTAFAGYFKAALGLSAAFQAAAVILAAAGLLLLRVKPDAAPGTRGETRRA